MVYMLSVATRVQHWIGNTHKAISPAHTPRAVRAQRERNHGGSGSISPLLRHTFWVTYCGSPISHVGQVALPDVFPRLSDTLHPDEQDFCDAFAGWSYIAVLFIDTSPNMIKTI